MTMIEFLWFSPVLMAILLYKYANCNFDQALTAFALGCFLVGAGYAIGESKVRKHDYTIFLQLPAFCQKAIDEVIATENDRFEPNPEKANYPHAPRN